MRRSIRRSPPATEVDVTDQTLDRSNLASLGVIEAWQQSRDPGCHHRLPDPGRAQHQQVVLASSGDDRSPLSSGLASNR